MGFREALLPVVVAASLAGCKQGESSPERANPTPAAREQVEIPPAPTPAAEQDPAIVAMNAYRNRITKQRKARVLLGACVAWQNQEGSTTITLNPGLVTLPDAAGNDANHYVFSAYDERYDPALIQMDSPAVGSPEILTMVVQPDDARAVGLKEVSLSKEPLRDKYSHPYFTAVDEADTPVMKTMLAEGIQTSDDVMDVCVRLNDHVPPGKTA